MNIVYIRSNNSGVPFLYDDDWVYVQRIHGLLDLTHGANSFIIIHFVNMQDFFCVDTRMLQARFTVSLFLPNPWLSLRSRSSFKMTFVFITRQHAGKMTLGPLNVIYRNCQSYVMSFVYCHMQKLIMMPFDENDIFCRTSSPSTFAFDFRPNE